MGGLRTFRLNARASTESMIEMANNFWITKVRASSRRLLPSCSCFLTSCLLALSLANKCRITKVSRAFPRVYAYTALACKEWISRAMNNHLPKFASFTILLTLAVVLAPVYRAQNLGSAVRISTIPDGAYYSVDGQLYTHASSAIWPAGSKHTLSTNLEEDAVQPKTKLTFSNWQFGSTILPGGSTVTITADPSINEYHATFTVQYAITLSFFSCPDPAHCVSPGTIYSGSTGYTSDTEIYSSPGGTVVLLASPNPGYVFAGWAPGPGQAIQGAVNSVTLNGPLIVHPPFQVARTVNLATVPAGLAVLADRGMEIGRAHV